MSGLNLLFSPEEMQKLQAHASRTGQSVEALALVVLKRRNNSPHKVDLLRSQRVE